MNNVHRLHDQPEPAPVIDHASRRERIHTALRSEYALAQKDEDAALKSHALQLTIIEGRKKALADEEAAMHRQHTADMALIRDRKLRARAYLDGGNSNLIAAE